MKYTFNIFLIVFLLISCLVIAQNRELSSGKVPVFQSGVKHNYSGDGTYLANIGYGHSSIRSATLSMPIPAGTPFDSLNSWIPPSFASSMAKGPDDRYYITEFTPSLYEFLPSDGSVILLGAITGMGTDPPNGIKYNPADGQYYIVSNTNFYSFNVSTRVATFIGAFNIAGGLMIDLCFDAAGTCYAYDLGVDNAYIINLATGNANFLGPLGYDALYGQGMSYDYNTQTIYLSAFNNTTFTGQLRTMDPATGMTSLIVDWGFEQVAPFALDISYSLPSAPTSLNANPISTSEIELTWTDNSTDEERFYIQRKEGTSGTYSDITSVGPDATDYTDSGLDEATEYCYRVRAFNWVGNSGYSNEDCATTQSTAPPVPVLVSPANGSTDIPVNANLTWNPSTGATSYSLQISFNNSFNPNVLITGIPTTNYTVQNLPHNTEFFWRVSASDSGGGTSAYSASWSFTTVSNVTITQTISFPNRTNPKDYVTSDYKLVGLPGDDNLNVASILSGTQGTDWQVYWDNGDSSDYFQIYSSSNPFQFTAGAAYWIVRKGNLSINQSVTGASLSTAGTFSIPLQNGINLITNPFTIPITWTNVLTVNGLPTSTNLNSFTAGWGTSSTMQPFAGYFFDNSTNLSQLIIPYPFGTEPLPKQISPDIWRIKIDLTCNELIDKTASFGTAIDASDTKDIHDQRKPRTVGSIPMVYFDHPEWNSQFRFFATDIRSDFENEQTWNFKVNSDLRENINLSFAGIESLPAQFQIYLIDQDRAKYVDLRLIQNYEFRPVKDISDFQILVGKPEFINSKLSEIIPKTFELGTNFPNPFNPSTTIEVSIPDKSEIRLLIYDILGQEIRVLFEGTADAGRQWYVWDGKDQQGLTVPSGIYVYSLMTGTGNNFSKKMVMMK